MSDTPWIGNSADKLFLQSGQFTSTIKTSQIITSIDIDPSGVTWDGTNTPWCGHAGNKLYLTSGQFTSTIKTSQDINSVDINCQGISWDGTNTPWTGNVSDKLILTSGQFTSTIKTSQLVSGVDTNPFGISYDATNTPWIGNTDDKLYLTSGQFTSTIKDSESTGGIDTGSVGISWDGTNTPWCGSADNKLYLISGQFTSTIKDSQSVGDNIQDICTNDVTGRLALGVEHIEAAISSVVFSQIAATEKTLNLVTASSITYSQTAIGLKILGAVAESTITFSQTDVTTKILSVQAESTVTFAQVSSSSIEEVFANNTLTFTQTVSAQHLVCSDRQHWARWILASVGEYFRQFASNNNLHFFSEGTYRYTEKHQEYIEFRIDGPNATELSKNYWKLDSEINILWGYNQDKDFHGPSRLKGLIIDAMVDICIYRYGDGQCDDQTLVGVLRIVHDKRTSTRVSDFGQIRQDVRLMQGTIEGTYQMFVTT